MKNRPTYAIVSVDHALHLAHLLQHEGPMQVAQAAERLGVARSTAHRLLAMLVYRDFAEQDVDKRYVAGPVLRSTAPAPQPADRLRAIALPHLQDLVDRTGETMNLMVRVGDRIRFVASVECNQVLRVGDREGKMLPAHLASGGKALLADLPDARIEQLCSHCDPAPDMPALLREMRLIRRRGFAVNDQETETGVTAVGVVVRSRDGDPMAAVAVAMPTARFSRTRLPEWVTVIAGAVKRIEQELDPT